MKYLDENIRTRLAAAGIPAADLNRFVRDLAGIVSSNPAVTAYDVNRLLRRKGWWDIHLDDDVLNPLIAGFKKTGVMGPPDDMPPVDTSGLQRLLEKIYHERGVDFRDYSRRSLTRRIGRRLQAKKVETFIDYADLLDSDPDEYEALFNDIIVRVTRFFRNRAAFRALEQALKSTLSFKESDKVRIWSAGCATGQEAFTVAMLLANILDEQTQNKIFITATDIDESALAMADQGVFNPEEMKDIPEEWREKYFTAEKKRYRICNEIRGMITFRSHNLVSDPPLSKVDIVICRNVLIYFTIGLQMKVIDKFYQALAPKGFLLLGRYEMLLKEGRRKFTCIDFDARLYQKR